MTKELYQLFSTNNGICYRSYFWSIQKKNNNVVGQIIQTSLIRISYLQYYTSGYRTTVIIWKVSIVIVHIKYIRKHKIAVRSFWT